MLGEESVLNANKEKGFLGYAKIFGIFAVLFAVCTLINNYFITPTINKFSGYKDEFKGLFEDVKKLSERVGNLNGTIKNIQNKIPGLKPASSSEEKEDDEKKVGQQ